jgi:signal peptidase II
MVLFFDQWLKIWVKTNMFLHQEGPLLGSFMPQKARIHFIENEGMAFGLKLDWEYGKLLLSVFRIIAVSFLAWFISTLIKRDYGLGVLLSFALILAGATGNIIDSTFYGLIFEESARHGRNVSQFVSWGEGYAPALHGKVVDMFHFPLFEFVWPEWIPKIGGNRFEFFRPVFNIADAAITVGVFILILFNRSFFKEEQELDKKKMEENTAEVMEDVEESNTADLMDNDDTPNQEGGNPVV